MRRGLNHDGHTLIACLGDSNTDEHVMPVASPTWCSKLTDAHHWKNVDTAITMSTIQPAPFPPGSCNRVTHTCPLGEACTPETERSDCLSPLNVATQLRQALARGAVPDTLIVASGTNDVVSLQMQHATAESLVATLRSLDATAAAAGIHTRWYALIPPMNPSYPGSADVNATIRRINAAIAAGLPGQTIDFYTGFDEPSYFLDAVHFNALGQSRRAIVAYERIA